MESKGEAVEQGLHKDVRDTSREGMKENLQRLKQLLEGGFASG